ncbi:MAG: CHAT domain-containing protein [Nostoc sp. ChiSLP02]|nr:CHAT domain-containing protein [Nostoc sp. DedSLP01]MDZ8185312.1 CHAT domain-containing protein [Nostoc sp. ChiSLP02]
MNTFEITIQRKSGNNWPIVVEHTRFGELLPLRSEGNLELTPENFQQLTSLLGQPKDYGKLLGKKLFLDDVRDAFICALRETEEALRMLLFIEASDPELRTLRWEKLCAPVDGDWELLALNQRVPFSFYIPAITDRSFPPIGRRDLRALVLVASPSDSLKYKLAEFDVAASVNSVKSALGEIPCDVLATLDGAIGLPTIDQLCSQLSDRNKQYTILHFVSHGRVTDSGETIVYWSKADNTVDAIPATHLLERLRPLRGAKGLPHFTFLCTCESASPEAEGSLGGLGQRLVRDLGMPAVVAMTDKVTIKTAQTLIESFYKQLRASGEVDSALHEATAALAKRGDITVPALFSRLGGRPLFSDQLDRNLTNSEIKYGLERLQVFLQERSPILQSKLQEPAQKLANVLNTNTTALSKETQQERSQALQEVNNLCQEVLDLTFNALALAEQPPVYDALCPFLGLYPFRIKDRKFFFGREKLIKQLQQQLATHNFLAVFGASGSGKSSMVVAGLIPALLEKQPDLVMAYMTPSSNPIEQLAATLSGVQNQSSILVIDQFEELFTLCTDENMRLEFIDKFLFVVQQQTVAITMRADFWGECASYPKLKELMQCRQELIGPMDTAELRKAMEMQAAQVGLRFEPGLSNRILDDVQDEPGAMPLLQHALLELWKRRHGRWLRSVEYEAIGGVNMAIAQTADAFYDSCTPEEQEQIKNIFVRLTRLDDSEEPGEKRRDTRRRVGLEELVPAGSDRNPIKQLLKRLAGDGARLIVTSVDSATQQEEVEVAHEALIRYWPKLLAWLDEDRTLLQLRETIRQAALEWEKFQKDESYLLHRGGRLEEAKELLKKSNFFNFLEANYVQACVELRDRQQQEQESRRRRDIRTNRTILSGAVVVIVTTSLGLIASIKTYEAELNKANSLSQNSLLLSKSHKDLQSLVEGIKARMILKNSIIGRLLWFKGKGQIDAQSKAIAALQQAIDIVQARNRLTAHTSAVTSVVFSPDGKTIATASNDTTIKLWDLKGKELTKSPLNHSAGVTSVVFSPDGKTLASVSEDKTVKVWDLNGNQLTKSPLKHDAAVTSAVFSSDGKTLASVSEDKTVKLWDLNGKELKKFLLQHGAEVTSVVFSSDGKTIASGSQDKTVKLWDLNGKLLHTFKHDAEVTTVVFSPDGKTLASVSKDKTVKLWDLKGKLLHTLKHGGEVTTVAFSPDNKILASGSENKTVKLWDLKKGKELTKLPLKHDAEVTTVVFSPDSKTLASVTKDNAITIWNLQGDRLKSFIGHEADVTTVAFSPDGSTLASASKDNTVILWNLQGKLLQTFAGHEAGVTSVAFSPDGNTLASTSKDKTVKLWSIDGKLQKTFTQHNYTVTGVAFSPDGNTLASSSEDSTIRFWNLKANFLQTFRGHQADVLIAENKPVFTSVAFALPPQTCNLLVSGSKDKTVKLWSIGNKLQKTFTGHKYAVTSVALSPDCQTVASGSVDNTVILWDLDGHPLHTFREHKAVVTSVAFSPNGQTLASASEDKTVILWNLKDAYKPQILKGHEAGVTSVAFNPNGKTLASASQDNTVILWSFKGKRLQTFRGHEAGVTSVVFSPDGKTLASGSDDKTVKFWHLKELHTLSKHQDSVNEVVFSPDGKTLASASDDKTVQLWDFTGKPLSSLPHHAAVVTVVFNPKGQSIASGSEDGTVQLWDVKTLTSKEPRSQILSKDGAVITSIAFSPDGKNLAFSNQDGTVQLWNLITNKPKIFQQEGAEIASVVFSADGKTLASASEDKTVKLWDLNGKLLQTLKHKAGVTSIVFSPDNQTIASGCEDGSVKVWNLNGNKPRSIQLQMPDRSNDNSKDGITSIVFSPDGKMLAASSEDETIELWNFMNWELQPRILKGHKAKVNSIVFSRDSKTLVSASEDETIKIWDLEGNELQTLIGHQATVSNVVFSPNGYTLASASGDNNVMLWDFNGLDTERLLDELMVRACNWTKDYLKNSHEVEQEDRHLCNRF